MAAELEGDSARMAVLDLGVSLMAATRHATGARGGRRGFGDKQIDSTSHKHAPAGIPVTLILMDANEYFIKHEEWAVHVRRRRGAQIGVSGSQAAFDRDITYLMMVGAPFDLEIGL